MVVQIGGGSAGSVHGVEFPALRGGTISAGGAVRVPRAGLALPPVTYTDETYGSGTYTITFVPTSDATGSLNPVTGHGSIRMQFWARLQSQSFEFVPDCGVGSEASPLALTLTTGRTSPPPPTAPIAGSGYDESSGRLTLVNNSVALPATSNCNPPFGAALNSELHLPSAAGRNSVVMDARLEPLIMAQRPPSLTRLRLLPRAFRTRAVRGAGPRPGTRVSYLLSEAATTRFRVERSLPGRRSGGRCVRPSRETHNRTACVLWVPVRGGFTRSAGPGAVSFRFAGRIGGRRLPPGRYRLLAAPRDALGTGGAVKRAAFRIER
jgi:hypothetical protein